MVRDLQGGQMARDMTIFIDDDGKAYHIYASEDNLTLHIAELTDDYLRHTGLYVRVAMGEQNEAPTIFKKDGVYWMITSGCTGWAPNAARLFRAKILWDHGNGCLIRAVAMAQIKPSVHKVRISLRLKR